MRHIIHSNEGSTTMFKIIVAILATSIAFAALGVTAAGADVGAAATATPYACWFDTTSPYAAHCFDSTATTADGSATAGWGSGDILSLTKDAPTPAYLVAGAVVNGFAGDPLFELGFDVRGYCNNGAPRFNVYSGDQTDFFGCALGEKTDLGDGWTHVEFGCNPFDDGSNGALCFDGESLLVTIDGIELIQDEQGTTALRNVTVNDILIGPPPAPTVAAPQQNRAGYCASKPVKRPGQDDGLFLDLLLGQNQSPAWKDANAVPAFELQPSGAITCLLPAGYHTTGQVDGIYPLASK